MKYDTTQGRFDGTVEVKEGGFEVNGKFVKVSAERDPEQIDWATDGVEIVLEATGFFAKKEAAEKHLKGGAKKVVITALVETMLKQSYSTLTTTFLMVLKQLSQVLHVPQTALAPMAKALQDNFGVVEGLMTTIHAYTGDQMILDGPHRGGDLRRAPRWCCKHRS